jgi:hypothetical protein
MVELPDGRAVMPVPTCAGHGAITWGCESPGGLCDELHFQCEDMDSAACVTSNDGPAVRNRATLGGGIARKRYDRGV